MIMINKLIIFSLGIIYFLIVSCNEQKHSEIILSEYNRFQLDVNKNNHVIVDSIILTKNTTAYFEFYDKNQVRRIKNTLGGRQYGHYFVFNTHGTLTKYNYLLGDSLHHSFSLEFNSSENKYFEVGSQFVDHMKDESGSSVGNTYSLLFSTFPRTDLKVYLSFDGSTYTLAKVEKSKMLPLLREAFVEVNDTTSNLFIKTNTSSLFLKLNGINESQTFFDTLKLGNR